MTSICTQLRTHFPITYEENCYKLSSNRFDNFDVNWQIPNYRGNDATFEPAYQQTRLPLDQRISKPSPDDPSIFLIDNFIQVKIPTVDFTNKALEFWEGRRNVSILTFIAASVSTLALLIMINPTCLFIAGIFPALGSALVIAVGITLVVGTLFTFALANVNLLSYHENQRELNEWKEIQAHLPSFADFPEKIAEIRAEIFDAYQHGSQFVDDGRSKIWSRFVCYSEKNFLVTKGIDIVHPNATPAERYDIYRRAGAPIHNSEPGPLWNYIFPQLEFAPLA